VKKSTRNVILFLSLWTLLAGIFAFTDLSISNTIINQKSGWVYFFDAFGEHPAMIIAFLSANILFSLARGEKTVKKISMWVINGVLMLLSGYMMVIMVAVRMFEAKISGSQSIITLLCTIIIIVIIQVLLRKVSYERLNEFRRAALIAIVTVFAYNILANVIKPVWGRARPRDLTADQSNYFPWYIQQHFPHGESFFSGHAGNGFSTLLLVLFAEKMKKPAVKWALGMGIVWGLIIAVSRVIIGAHFPSDVLFGGFIAISLIYINSCIFKEKIIEKKLKNKLKSEVLLNH
jgi:membrane-associated phospholipid phosphatase